MSWARSKKPRQSRGLTEVNERRFRPLAPGFAGVLVAVLCTAFARPAFAVDPKQITTAIDKGLKYVIDRQKDGHWEEVSSKISGDESDTRSGQYTGRTALAVWTLLSGGKSASDPAVAAGIKFLEKTPTDGVYALGVRMQIWAMLPPSMDVTEAMHRDAALLLNGVQGGNDLTVGFYGYLASDLRALRYDHSVSQFGVLGTWAAAQSGINVPRNYWEMTALSWMAHQTPRGGWGYVWAKENAANETASMTAAGVATLFVAQDQLAVAGTRSANDFASLASFGGKEVATINSLRAKQLWQARAGGGDAAQTAIDAGVDWIAGHYDLVTATDQPFYTLFGVSRIGAASGRKFIGTHDWYAEGSTYILAHQREDGSFGGREFTDSCLALLFLERGLAPVMINKLQYTRVPAPGAATPADAPHWNNRTRDANNLARWYGHSTERFFNWQVVSLANGPDELHDSPILYLAGDQPLEFSAADEAKLREFVEQGGLILGNADDGREAFAASFRKLGSHLFHQYEFRELPATHPIYTNEQFPRAKWKSKPEVLGLSNGIRELMILIPHADPAKTWQSQATDHPELHQLAADIYLYMADRDHLQYRLPSFIVRPEDKVPAGKPLAIAQIYYANNWNPEPGGWRRVAAVLHNDDGIEITTEPVRLTDASAAEATPAHAAKRGTDEIPSGPPAAVLSNQKLAVLTGSVGFTFSAAQRQAIKQYVQGGGTLFIDAAGGASAFKGAIEAEMTATFGPDGNQLAKQLDLSTLPQSPIARELAAVGAVTFRPGTTAVIGKGDHLRLRGIVIDGRLAVIYSPEDVTEGLVGEPVDGVIGYSPATATDILRAIARGLSKAP
jgi:hypothetical protein